MSTIGPTELTVGLRDRPALVGAAYPDVLVARAVTDGGSLDLVLRPGNGAIDTALALERLVPGRTYRATRAKMDQFIVEPDGSALVERRVEGCAEIRIEPVVGSPRPEAITPC